MVLSILAPAHVNSIMFARICFNAYLVNPIAMPCHPYVLFSLFGTRVNVLARYAGYLSLCACICACLCMYYVSMYVHVLCIHVHVGVCLYGTCLYSRNGSSALTAIYRLLMLLMTSLSTQITLSYIAVTPIKRTYTQHQD